MFRQISKNKAAAVLEYMILITFLLGVFLIFQEYIIRGIGGYWKKGGDIFGYGRRYEPGKTKRCAYDFEHTNGVWYDLDCFEAHCDCFSVRQDDKTCKLCIEDQCADPECNQE
ncbi:MAG: hypothetical protein WC552_06435 [Candidatus Omnitrophota bacterium]